MAGPLLHVIDDDEGMRASLQFLLETAGFPVMTYASAVDFLAAERPSEGVIVTDVRMPDMTGLELMEALNQKGCATPVIVISGHGDIPMAVAAMRAGAVDFLEKPFPEDALLSAIQMALTRKGHGEDAEEAARLKAMLDGLSRRETDVLRGLVEGGSNKSIAADLDISPRTVEVYRANLMRKTGAVGLADLVRLSLIGGFR